MCIRNYILASSLLALAAVSMPACEKTEYSFGEIKAPTDLVLDLEVEGADAANPDGNGSGRVQITAHAGNAITYKIDFGDGTTRMVPGGKITYKYGNPGTNEYVVTVNAIGTGGVMSTLSKKVRVNVVFEIPSEILEALTGTGSKTWVTDNLAPGHIGVGPADAFEPIWYQAAPDEKAFVGCFYDDEITFSRDANNRVSMTIDNKGASFIQGASVSSYGFDGPEDCYPLDVSGTKLLTFSDAVSGIPAGTSTQIQFTVPGNGAINFATGANTYEILSITETTMHLRNIGVDGNSWYQKLKVKP
jgi:hypothetical protein